ncbi:hypothetical protein BDP27DRAFT_1328524 [Rhodocollybia butyracea]|uniref:Uncharacterized protein n=1 Tax=Rhodocollybia butyracea TaxID=206335 RepID=A0A9P5U6F6_9AGAR|nr:hypothetical protein BDP27DRAFT_1328524 [Rhodocollybia butyracea]
MPSKFKTKLKLPSNKSCSSLLCSLSLPLFLCRSFFLSSIFTLLFLPANGDGDVTCSGTGLNWYMNIVGESPCTTYEKLRQICNPTYQVGTLNPNTPPDTCNDQVSDCCCNSVAFGLSMLCLNCQQGTGSSGNGIDAGQGAYQDYTESCTPVTNQSLPSNIDNAVCDAGIKIIDDLYSRLYWSDGSCVYSEETISTDVAAADGDAFTHCASAQAQIKSSSTSTTAPTSSSSSSTTAPASPTTSNAQANNPSFTSPTSELSSSTRSAGSTTSGAGVLPSQAPTSSIIIITTVISGSSTVITTSAKRYGFVVGQEKDRNRAYYSTLIQIHFRTNRRQPANDPFANLSQQALSPTTDPFSNFSQQPSSLGYIPEKVNHVREPSSSTMADQSEPDAPPMRHVDAGPVRLAPRMSGNLPPPAYGEQI